MTGFQATRRPLPLWQHLRRAAWPPRQALSGGSIHGERRGHIGSGSIAARRAAPTLGRGDGGYILRHATRGTLLRIFASCKRCTMECGSRAPALHRRAMLGARAPQRGRAAWLPHEKRQSRRMAGPHAKACGAQTGSVAADQKGGSPATAGPHSKAPGAKRYRAGVARDAAYPRCCGVNICVNLRVSVANNATAQIAAGSGNRGRIAARRPLPLWQHPRRAAWPLCTRS
jgi:hypothetical protein